MRLIDDFLNQITMYRLVLYALTVFLVAAWFLSLLGFLPFGPINLAVSWVILLTSCWVTNKIFAYIFEVPTNVDSVYITAFILTLIITPIKNTHEVLFLGWAGVLAMSSKYILALNKKHIFNPAAVAVVITSLALNNSASWWVGTTAMMPFVLLGGLLIVKKIRRWSLVLTFFAVSLLTILGYNLVSGNDPLQTTQKIFLETPILFFAFIMLTEPLTSPPTKFLQMIYGGLVGFLFAPFIHLGSFYSTPELSLIVGNIFAWIVSPKEKLILKLKDKVKVAEDIYDFVFGLDQKLAYQAGQYMEWTLGQEKPDSRGSRRYFTLASSPTENSLRIGVKFYPNGSSWKKTLSEMKVDEPILAGQLSGEFTLPKNPSQKLVLMAGGIGVTPYRAMIKYLIDKGEKRDMVLLYSVKNEAEIAYKDIFESGKAIGLKTFYITTDSMGYLDAPKISKAVPDFKERKFYISGPHGMVDAFEKTLKSMGVSSSQIKIDFFPGYA